MVVPATRLLAVLALSSLLGALPTRARAGEPLRLAMTWFADADGSPPAPAPATEKGATEKPPADSFDFDLLGKEATPAPAPSSSEAAMRRTLLTLHQGFGVGLFALTVATAIVGQLNYNDRFAGSAPPGTARYELSHAALGFTTLGVFAVTGLLAIFAPTAGKQHAGIDRIFVHKIAMIVATVGMLLQGVIGYITEHREGYLNQSTLAVTHLVSGYATAASMSVAVGVIVF